MAYTSKDFRLDSAGVQGRVIEGRASTPSVDRGGDLVVQRGIDVTNFRRMPRLLWQHEEPIGRVLSLNISEAETRFRAEFSPRPDWLPESEPWLPDRALALYQSGAVDSFSIGYRPIEVRPPTRAEREKYGPELRQVLERCELLEISLVTVPMNQDARSGSGEIAVQRSQYAESLCKAIKLELERREWLTGEMFTVRSDETFEANIARAEAMEVDRRADEIMLREYGVEPPLRLY